MAHECETVDITVTHQGVTVARMTVPSYTRSGDELAGVIVGLWDYYLRGSETNGMSLGDFALLLLSRASDEPRFIE